MTQMRAFALSAAAVFGLAFDSASARAGTQEPVDSAMVVDTVPSRADTAPPDSVRISEDSLGSTPGNVSGPPATTAGTLTAGLQITPLVFPWGPVSDRIRLEHLRGAQDIAGFLLRSPSSMLGAAPPESFWRVGLIPPEVHIAHNSALPFSLNDGGMWAGVGTSSRAVAGVLVDVGPLRIVAAPELIVSENAFFLLRDTTRFYAPPVPRERRGGGFVFPWYVAPHSIDLPMRFGSEPIRRTWWGQSTAMLRGFGVGLGVSTENQWWGPGIRNAIVLSSNAAGFPHFFVRTERPLRIPGGEVESRLIAGGLTESEYFDTTSTNNLRSLSAFALTFRPNFSRNLVLGASRSVFATTSGWQSIPGRMLHAFVPTGRPNNRPLADSALTPGGRDQIYSLFGRWIAPADGFETWFEWARTEFPLNLRDLLTAPNHTQAYTLGLQWMRPAFRATGAVRLQGEITTLEQSATWRDRPIGSYYTSRRVIQGYTERGESLGAAIGPGASSQWLAADYLEPAWTFGIFAGRIRWNQDIQSTFGFPQYQGYCIHDVSVFPGARGSAHGKLGYISAELTLANRLNAFFQEASGCPRGNAMLDIRNRTLTVTVGTFTPGRAR